MGRLFFLSAMAFLAYKYIGRSNKKALPHIGFKAGNTEVLPPLPIEASKQVTIRSAAAEPDPQR